MNDRYTFKERINAPSGDLYLFRRNNTPVLIPVPVTWFWGRP